MVKGGLEEELGDAGRCCYGNQRTKIKNSSETRKGSGVEVVVGDSSADVCHEHGKVVTGPVEALVVVKL